MTPRRCPERRRRAARARTSRVARLLALTVLLALTWPVAAQPPPPPAFTMQATMVGPHPFGSAAHTEFPVTVRMQGAATRVDFAGPRGERGLMLHDGSGGPGWLMDLDQGQALPLDRDEFRALLADPAQPCAHLRVRCQPTGPRHLGGQVLGGWRYRNAEGRGPGGTSDGDFWLDATHGLIVAYRGTKRGRHEVHELRATAVEHGPIPEVLFQLPHDIPLPGADRQR